MPDVAFVELPPKKSAENVSGGQKAVMADTYCSCQVIIRSRQQGRLCGPHSSQILRACQ